MWTARKPAWRASPRWTSRARWSRRRRPAGSCAQLLGRSQERHRLSGAGRDPAARGAHARRHPNHRSAEDLGRIPLKRTENGQVLVRDVAEIKPGPCPASSTATTCGGRSRSRRTSPGRSGVRLAARSARRCSGPASRRRASGRTARADPADAGDAVGLSIGPGIAVVAVFLLLTANFQSMRLALVTVSTFPPSWRAWSDAVAHRHDAQHPVVHRRDHGDRRGDGQCHSAGHVCRAAPARGGQAAVDSAVTGRAAVCGRS
jgi:hypothetical protein